MLDLTIYKNDVFIKNTENIHNYPFFFNRKQGNLIPALNV